LQIPYCGYGVDAMNRKACCGPEVAQRLGIPYRMEKVTGITKNRAFGAASTPALAKASATTAFIVSFHR